MKKFYGRVTIAPRIHERHPEITDADVQAAWRAQLDSRWRVNNSRQLLAIGVDGNGRQLEMVAKLEKNYCWLVFHAQTPPTKRTLKELGILRRRMQ